MRHAHQGNDDDIKSRQEAAEKVLAEARQAAQKQIQEAKAEAQAQSDKRLNEVKAVRPSDSLACSDMTLEALSVGQKRSCSCRGIPLQCLA